MNKEEFTFYGTFGHGQLHFPDYFEVHVIANSKEEAEMLGRKRMSDATDNRYCCFHDSLEKVHKQDRIYRGKA